MDKVELSGKESIDIDFWKNDPHEAPESDSIHNIIKKLTDAPNLLECQQPFDAIFRESRDILELGGGQGWASCMLKCEYPEARFTVTDISEYAVASVPKWERIFKVKMEKAFASKSYEIPVEDASYDCIFTFAAAHHFMAHRKTLKEIHRVLKPGGHCFYFHEPCCRKWAYPMAYKRVNRLREDVAEDLLVYPKLLRIAREEGLEAKLHYMPTLNKRRPLEYFYFFALKTLPFLQRIVPATGTFHFTKKA